MTTLTLVQATSGVVRDLEAKLAADIREALSVGAGGLVDRECADHRPVVLVLIDVDAAQGMGERDGALSAVPEASF